MGKQRLFFVLGVIVALFVIFATVYLFWPSQKKNNTNTISPSPTEKSTSFAYHIPTLNTFPLGTIDEANDHSSFIMIAKIDTVAIDGNGNVKSHISFKLQNGQGVDATTNVLLYSTESSGSIIGITFQKTPVLFPSRKDTNTITIDLKKNPQEFVNLMKKYKNIPLLITFLSGYPTKSTVNKPIPTEYQKQIQFISDIKSCNSGFLSYLKTGENMPSCVPYTYQIGIYNSSL